MKDVKDYYSTRFTDHFKAIGYSQRQKELIKNQIDDFLQRSEFKYTLMDFRFLEEISELVVRARRALTYTYAMRFLSKKNPAKNQLFDFLQGDLEGALEKLVVIQESDWRAYLDDTELMMGEPREKLGERFFKYKTEMNRLKGILEN